MNGLSPTKQESNRFRRELKVRIANRVFPKLGPAIAEVWRFIILKP